MLDTTPWYRQFWPWFLIALPATIVVAGIGMVIIASIGADSLVRDNYYKEGLAINLELGLDRTARDLDVSAALRLDSLVGEMLVRIDGSIPDQIELVLIHPTQESRDQTLSCRPRGGQDFICTLASAPQGRWYVDLRATAPQAWRLKGEQDFSASDTLQLQPEP
ncbi:MAG TPA: FixH family protein [Spongiibacteraceae bacterium]|nr:FixH family protein [Spongiibacteraceae bacterium]